MADDSSQPPDLTQGVEPARIPDGGILAGKVAKDDVLLFRSGDEICAVAATCTHQGGPLAEGLVDGETVRCPWHHACFSLRSGEALRAPAFAPLDRWRVEHRDRKAVVTAKLEPRPKRYRPSPDAEPIVIVGGGAAAFAAADGLLRRGCDSPVTMISADTEPPYDRTTLTKEHLDGSTPEDKLPLAPSLAERGVKLELEAVVEAIEPEARRVRLKGGRTLAYGKLLLATGAEPRRLDLPGAEPPHVRLLRTLDDCRALIERLDGKPRVVVIGGSFIGMEAAASLVARELEVHVVTPDREPMARQFGPELSRLIVGTHRKNGTKLHLERKPARIGADAVTLDDGTRLPADLVLVGIGVTPRTGLAEKAGLATDNGVLVDGCLRTSRADIWAAGDIARWADPHSGRRIRVEHWVVAERQGQHAAAAMLGNETPFDDVPFFWTRHFDLIVNYVGHAERWDELTVEGDLAEGDALVRFRAAGRDLAVATVGRDLESLKEELAIERRLRQKRGEPTIEQPAR